MIDVARGEVQDAVIVVESQSGIQRACAAEKHLVRIMRWKQEA